MSEFNPIPNSLKKFQGTCPSTLINGNCSNSNCEWMHPKIKKIKKKKLQFKKKEFKPSKIVKKGKSFKQRMKQKNLINKGKVYSFQPSKNISQSFKKKQKPTESKPGVQKVERDEKLRELQKCTCCKGNYTDCNNSAMCMGLGQCFCKMHLDMENNWEEDTDEGFQLGNIISDFPGGLGGSQGQSPYQPMGDDFVPECINCICCNGYIFSCNGSSCFSNCFCINM